MIKIIISYLIGCYTGIIIMCLLQSEDETPAYLKIQYYKEG